MSKPKAPPPPDYAAAATAQGAANVTAAQNQAALNNPNITNPYGSQQVTYTPTGPNGDMQANITQSLTPEAQQALTAQQNVQSALGGLAQQGIGQAQNILGTPFQYNGPAIQTSIPSPGSLNYGPQMGQYGFAGSVTPGPSAQTGVNTSGIAQAPINAGTTAYQAQMNLLQPQIDQQRAALTQQLQNQGIPIGSEAYNNAMRAEGQQIGSLEDQAAVQGVGLQEAANAQGFNQALSQAGLYNQGLAQNFGQNLAAQGLANQAVGQNYGIAGNLAGLYNQAQGQNFGQGLQGAQFGNTAAQQALAQQLGLYNQPLNEITALMSGSQIQAPQFQQYQGGGNIGAAPVFQAATNQGNYNTAVYNAQQQGLGGLFGGLGSMAGSFLSNPAAIPMLAAL